MSESQQLARELIHMAACHLVRMIEVRRDALDMPAIAAGNLYLAGMLAGYDVIQADLVDLMQEAAS